MAREIMKKILLAVISVLLMGCQQGVVYTEFASLPSVGWEADSMVCFTPVLTDTVGSYDMSIVMRHTDRYAYQNLWLFVDVKADSVVIRRDTINGMLADEKGNWYGKGMYIFLKALPLVRSMLGIYTLIRLASPSRVSVSLMILLARWKR